MRSTVSQRWRSVNFPQKERIIRDSTLSLWHQGPAKVSERQFQSQVLMAPQTLVKIVTNLVTAAVWQGVEATVMSETLS